MNDCSRLDGVIEVADAPFPRLTFELVHHPSIFVCAFVLGVELERNFVVFNGLEQVWPILLAVGIGQQALCVYVAQLITDY